MKPLNMPEKSTERKLQILDSPRPLEPLFAPEGDVRDHTVWMEVSGSNLSHNFRSLQDFVGQDTTIFAVIKGNAYGHGAVPVVRVLKEAGATHAAVSSLREAKQLRKAGIDLSLLILGSVHPEVMPSAIQDVDAALVLSDPNMIPVLEQAAQATGKPAHVHLFVNTGMNREGIRPEDAFAVAEHLANSSNCQLEGLMTHFADSTKPELTSGQLTRFNQFLDEWQKRGMTLPPLIHAADGNATILRPEAHFADPNGRLNAVRIGTQIYGLVPGVVGGSEFVYPYRPKQIFRSLKASLHGVKIIPKGEGINYKQKPTEKDTRIGLIDIGHCDGFRPSHSIGDVQSDVLIRGQRVPVHNNRESMGMSIVVLPDEGEFSYGDEVVIIGKQGQEEITLEEAASTSGINNIFRYLDQLSAERIPRVIIND